MPEQGASRNTRSKVPRSSGSARPSAQTHLTWWATPAASMRRVASFDLRGLTSTAVISHGPPAATAAFWSSSVLVPRPWPTSSTRSPGAGAHASATSWAARSHGMTAVLSTRPEDARRDGAPRRRDLGSGPSCGSQPASRRESNGLPLTKFAATQGATGARAVRALVSTRSASHSGSAPTSARSRASYVPEPTRSRAAATAATSSSATRRSTALARPAARGATERTSSTPWLTATSERVP